MNEEKLSPMQKWYKKNKEKQKATTKKYVDMANRRLSQQILSNSSPPVRTSPNGDFSNEKEHNIN